MARQSSDLFKNRSATQEFLFSRSDDVKNEGQPGKAGDNEYLANNNPLTISFPDMLDRQRLIHTIETTLGTATPLCIIVAQFETETGSEPNGEPETQISIDMLTPIVTVCRDHGGAWARIGGRRFAFVFPQLTSRNGQELAKRMKNNVAVDDTPPITIGVAAYPTLNYTRAQIIENGEKALNHAGFFGPGSITAFDAVSLNISGDRYYQTGDIDAAIDEFKKGLLLDPADVNLHISLGVCYGVIKDYENALAAFDHAIWLAPDEVMAVYNKGYILMLMGNRNQALECFLTADAMEPDLFEVVFHIGLIHMELDAAEAAKPYLEAATLANSRSGPAFKSLGTCLYQLGLTKEAIRAYKTVVKINPDDAESLSMLGKLYAKRGESLDVASVFCKQSIRISPDNGLFRHRLGHVYLNQGRLNHALAEFERAVTLGHDSQPLIEETQHRLMAVKAS